MTFVDITLTQQQLAGIAAAIGGAADSYVAVKGLQLVCITALKGTEVWETIGINPDNAIFSCGLKLVQQ